MLAILEHMAVEVVTSDAIVRSERTWEFWSRIDSIKSESVGKGREKIEELR